MSFLRMKCASRSHWEDPISTLGYGTWRVYLLTMTLKFVFQGSKFSNRLRTNSYSYFHLYWHLSHPFHPPPPTYTHTCTIYRFVSPAAVYFHNITSSFTRSHYSILKASSPTVVHALQMCQWHQVCQIFTILNYLAAGMPLLMKISCSH